MHRFVQWGAWSLLGSVLFLFLAIDATFVIEGGGGVARGETNTLGNATRKGLETRKSDAEVVQSESDSPIAPVASVSTQWREWKQVWVRYHRIILPIAVASFFLSFGLWSLLAVENLAIRPLSS